MKKILVVIDMQNDFIDGALGTKEAEAIVDRVAEKIRTYSSNCIYATRDTHEKDYLQTMEGNYLPVEHCIRGTKGWQLHPRIEEALKSSDAQGAVIVDKSTFGSQELTQRLGEEYEGEDVEIELIGLCTDICVVTNALLLKTRLPQARIQVDASCCAGVTPESHVAALLTMKMCQIEVENT
ncbi:MAG: cysteine hydrolase [Lachnospiraceae bacterium]|nr:cysteine hydrolase [Lachnospiraceae bacterium]